MGSTSLSYHNFIFIVQVEQTTANLYTTLLIIIINFKATNIFQIIIDPWFGLSSYKNTNCNIILFSLCHDLKFCPSYCTKCIYCIVPFCQCYSYSYLIVHLFSLLTLISKHKFLLAHGKKDFTVYMRPQQIAFMPYNV